MKKECDSLETYASGIKVSTFTEKITSTQHYWYVNTVILSQTMLAETQLHL